MIPFPKTPQNTSSIEKEESEKIVSFLSAVLEAREHEENAVTCPICGGTIHISIAETNQHIHASCDGCGTRIME